MILPGYVVRMSKASSLSEYVTTRFLLSRLNNWMLWFTLTCQTNAKTNNGNVTKHCQDIECFPSSQAQNFKVLQKVRTSLPTILTQFIP